MTAPVRTVVDRPGLTILNGDALAALRDLPDGSVHTCVTSPPYWCLRDYGHEDQIGWGDALWEYIGRLLCVFEQVRRVLRDDGTLWLNIGDTYNSGPSGGTGGSTLMGGRRHQLQNRGRIDRDCGLKHKDLVGVPWRLAFALQDAGWHLRQDVIWSKPNPMPESVRDRCTKAHEYVFLLSKSPRYHFDADAIAEPAKRAGEVPGGNRVGLPDKGFEIRGESLNSAPVADKRNARSVWEITSEPVKDAHFAVMPLTLARRCVRATCPPGGVVLDPFFGAGTTGLAAMEEGCQAIGVELNPEYCDLAAQRLAQPSLLL